MSCARWKIIDDPLFWPMHGPQEPAASRRRCLGLRKSILGWNHVGQCAIGRGQVTSALAGAGRRGALTPSEPIAGRSPHF